MAASSAPRSMARAEAYDDARDSSRGWVQFAGAMLALLGTMNVIYGIAAISKAHVFVADADYVVAGLNAWGWLLLFAGLLQWVCAFGIWGRTAWGRWLGIAGAGLNAIFQLMWMPAFPLLALALFALDIL